MGGEQVRDYFDLLLPLLDCEVDVLVELSEVIRMLVESDHAAYRQEIGRLFPPAACLPNARPLN